MKRISWKQPMVGLLSSILGLSMALATPSTIHWVKIKAKDKVQRSAIADTGITIEYVGEDHVTGLANSKELEALKSNFELEVNFPMTPEMMDYPDEDSKFHNYDELYSALQELAGANGDIVSLNSIGRTHEGREIYTVRISADLANASDLPGIIFMGGHHAREHISVEMPLMLAQYLVREYRAQNAEVVRLVQTRDIHIVPIVNPDGAEHDIAQGRYKMWRKNRKNNGDGSFGVDLNRNYGFKWGTGGSSKNKSSDTYMGEQPFSEPETQAIKSYVESNKNITILLSYHTFSELILFPWGHKYDSIEDNKAFRVHETMANRMAQWNRYTPQQSSDLYIASGDTTDWSFGEHGIISFTFELDPKNFWEGGFYPGQDKIDVVFRKNINPALYLIDFADNPYRSIEPSHKRYGLSSPIIQ
ncbi:MAG: M14 family metallopeptidase [Bdellovibrionales bacterium]